MFHKLNQVEQRFEKLTKLLMDPQVITDPSQGFRPVKRPGDVIHTPNLKTPDDALVIVLGRDKDDRDIPGFLPLFQMAAGFKTTHPGHHHIQQDQIGLDT